LNTDSHADRYANNRLRLCANVTGKEATRYTPAGIAVVKLMLQYTGDPLEAGAPRTVEFEIAAYALGAVAKRAEAATLGQTVQVHGFLAPVRKGAKLLALHITDIEFEN
jgi:primosomal replication protein N